MAKLLPNRISEVMTEAQIQQFIAGVKMALEALPKKPVLSSEEFARLPKKGEAREKEAAQMIRIVRRFPKFLPSSLPLLEVEKDSTLYEQLNTLDDEHLSQLVELMAFLMGLSGAEEMNVYLRFEENVKVAANDGDPDAIEALNMINAVDRNRGGGTNNKSGDETKKK